MLYALLGNDNKNSYINSLLKKRHIALTFTIGKMVRRGPGFTPNQNWSAS